MCTCAESRTSTKKRTTLNLSASVQDEELLLRSRKRPRNHDRPHRRVRFAEHEELPKNELNCPNGLLVGPCLRSSTPRHPFVPSDQWLQPWEQQLQRHAAMKEAQQLSSDPEAEQFRDLYQSIYQVCHALANNAAAVKSTGLACETVKEDNLVVLCAQLLSSSSNGGCCGSSSSTTTSDTNNSNNTCDTTTTTTTRRGLEDGLVPLVAVARRLERRQTIRVVLALQKEPDLAALVSQHLSTAHGKFAHALALGDAAAAQLVYTS